MKLKPVILAPISLLALTATSFAVFQDEDCYPDAGPPAQTTLLTEELDPLPAFDDEPILSDEEEEGDIIDFLASEIESLSDLVKGNTSGTTKHLLTGYASAGFTEPQVGKSSFNAAFFPIFLWKLSDRILFAAELEIEVEDSDHKFALEFMEIDYVINDYLNFRAGKILTPLSTFKEQLHPAWINKLPNQPLFAGGGARLIPTSSVGAQLSGAFAVQKIKLTYAGWVSNGPSLNTTGSSTGQLSFSNFSDINDHKAIGGRFSVFPIPELEIAYAVLWSKVGADGTGFENVHALIHDLSIGLVFTNDRIKGRVDGRFEYVWSRVGYVNYGAVATIPHNKRDGVYAQIAYRPTQLDMFLKDIEVVFRWDFIDNPSDAKNGTSTIKAYDEHRYTFGANYWLSPSAVLKIAYMVDDVRDPQRGIRNSNQFLLQFAIGF